MERPKDRGSVPGTSIHTGCQITHRKPTVRSPEVKQQTGSDSYHSSPLGCRSYQRHAAVPPLPHVPSRKITRLRTRKSSTYKQTRYVNNALTYGYLKHSAIHFNAKYKFCPRPGTLYSTNTKKHAVWCNFLLSLSVSLPQTQLLSPSATKP